MHLSVLEVVVVARIVGPAHAAGVATESHQSAELSHDLAVPLTAIIANLEMIEEELGEDPPPAVATLLARVVRSADRMQRMLHQCMERDTAPASRWSAEVDLHALAHELAADSTELLAHAGARLEIATLPVVHANPDAMYSVLQNLLTNAVKFARPGVVPRLSISATRVRSAWRVSVTDNGIGIPAQRRTEVFTPFIRANAQLQGHGIGLGTVARIVHALGGRVGVDEAPGGGAEVWFEVPTSPDEYP
jgi:signal transduction histidine kinase